MIGRGEMRSGVVQQIRGALIVAAGLGLALAAARAGAIENEPKARIAFVGDSLADGYWEGITVVTGRDACLRTHVELGRFAKNSTGLTRPDKLDWASEIRRIGESFKPNLFVMSVGLNDRQSVVEHGQITPDNSPGYDDKYKERITAVLRNTAASKASLLWIGLPAMRAPVTDKDTREKNRLYEEAIAAFGAPNLQYVQPWKLAATGVDTFASFGPDQNGRMVQLRTPDGEHFTVSGEVLTAVYLLPRILASLAASGTAPCAQAEGGQTQ
jgi:hypothetical protein